MDSLDQARSPAGPNIATQLVRGIRQRTRRTYGSNRSPGRPGN